MLNEFAFLGEEKAHELVVENSNKIAAEIDDNIRPVKDKLYPPHMKGAEQEIQDRTWNTARKWYGDPLPQLVQDRIELELNSIVKNGFSVHVKIRYGRLPLVSSRSFYLHPRPYLQEDLKASGCQPRD